MKRFQRAFAFLLLVALVFAGAAAAEETANCRCIFCESGAMTGF